MTPSRKTESRNVAGDSYEKDGEKTSAEQLAKPGASSVLTPSTASGSLHEDVGCGK
jgi:hypothetical protein